MDLTENNISIDRLKAIVNGTDVEQTKIVVGYNGQPQETVTREIGEKWVDEDGNEWEQKAGYSIKLGKMDELRTELKQFKNCPKETCTCEIPNRLDKKMKVFHDMCFDCVIEMEHKMRLNGTYKQYENDRIKKNALEWIEKAEKDKEYIIQEMTRTLEFANATGMVEKWDNNINIDELKNKIEIEFEKFKTETLKNLEKLNET